MSMDIKTIELLEKIVKVNSKMAGKMGEWLGDDVRQHDDRLKEYKRHTDILIEILAELKEIKLIVKEAVNGKDKS